MGKQLEIMFGDPVVDFSRLFSIMPSYDLADEFLSYKSPGFDSKEYNSLVSEISKRKEKDESFDNWAKKYKMTKTKQNDLKFYNYLNEKGISPNEGNVFSLRGAIRETHHYSSLWKGSNNKKTDRGVIKKGYKDRLEKVEPEQIRSFSIKSYNRGQKFAELLKS